MQEGGGRLLLSTTGGWIVAENNKEESQQASCTVLYGLVWPVARRISMRERESLRTMSVQSKTPTSPSLERRTMQMQQGEKSSQATSPSGRKGGGTES